MFAAGLSPCWVVTDGKAGMESQCLGLAEALGLNAVVKRVKLRAPWRALAPYFHFGLSHAFDPAGDPLAPPWPKLLIASGRLSVPAALYVREASRRAGAPTLTVQIQNPVIAPAQFDLVVTPEHDRLSGPNVMTTLGALHRVTRARLNEAAARFGSRVAGLPRPYIGVLVGGSNAAYSMVPRMAAQFGAQLAEAAMALGGSLLVTPSRRTGAENLAAAAHAIDAVPHFVWDETGDNPYFGILGIADYLVVTCDSVNMVSEACATGRPVYVQHLPGGSRKFRRFHDVLQRQGVVRPFGGVLEDFAAPPHDDMTKVANAVLKIATGRL